MDGERAQQAAQLQALVDQSRKIVFFGGAGVSTESGIPDFRSRDGLYSQQFKYPPEQMLSATFYHHHKADFFEFYRSKILSARNARPNPAHLKLAELERAGRLLAVITQNIDGLHQEAGSERVVELHGSIHRNYCQRCGNSFDANFMAGDGAKDAPPPTCPCGGDVKPDVVLYQESLDTGAIEAAVRYIGQADCLIIGGTSLVVHPAASLLDYYRGDRLVVINKSPTPMDRRANLLIADSIGAVFAGLRATETEATAPEG